MSEDKFENVMRELREAAPPAPERLRGVVRSLPKAQPRLAFRLRPALSAAVVIALAVGLGAALIGGLKNTPTGGNVASYAGRSGGDAKEGQKLSETPLFSPDVPEDKAVTGASARALDQAQRTALGKWNPVITPGMRLQQYGVTMSLRVRDLSRSTQAAVRQTRRLGGYVAAADYATDTSAGDSILDLRVPVQNVQRAIAKFTDLGTILSQRIAVEDLQAPLDRTDSRIATQQKIIAELETKSVRTPAEQTRLDTARATLKRLTQSRTNLVREGTYAKISLRLTTKKEAAKETEPGAFGRFWDNASGILAKEAIAVLYALVVAGPFAILAALFLLAERARRRRADHRLLEGTG